jgi:hypothetical protein
MGILYLAHLILSGWGYGELRLSESLRSSALGPEAYRCVHKKHKSHRNKTAPLAVLAVWTGEMALIVYCIWLIPCNYGAQSDVLFICRRGRRVVRRLSLLLYGRGDRRRQ